MQGIVFVYDITNEPSFQNIVKWASDVDEVRQQELPFFSSALNADTSFALLVELLTALFENGNIVFVLFVWLFLYVFVFFS